MDRVGAGNITCIRGIGHMVGVPHTSRHTHPSTYENTHPLPGHTQPLPMASGGPHCSIGHLPPLQEWHLVVVAETGSRYGWQAGGTHRTGMMSCLKFLKTLWRSSESISSFSYSCHIEGQFNLLQSHSSISFKVTVQSPSKSQFNLL